MKYLFKFKTAILTLFVLGFVTVATVGCGSSSDDFIYDTSHDTGRLQFHFQRLLGAQTTNNLSFPSTTNVPAQTATLRFDFYETVTPSAASLNVTLTQPYSDLITFDLRPTVRSVIVTAFDAANNKLAAYQGTFTVIVGDTVDVNLYPIGSQSFVVTATPPTLQVGTNSVAYTALYTPTNSTTPQTIPESQLSFAKISGPPGVTVAANGDITVPAGPGTSPVSVQVTYVVGGNTYTDIVSFGFGNAGNAGNGGNKI